MIHLFNRKELITVTSNRRLYRLQAALDAAAIPYRTKSALAPLNSDRYHGTPGLDQDAAQPTVLYVKAEDYDRARAAIQPALREP